MLFLDLQGQVLKYFTAPSNKMLIEIKGNLAAGKVKMTSDSIRTIKFGKWELRMEKFDMLSYVQFFRQSTIIASNNSRMLLCLD